MSTKWFGHERLERTYSGMIQRCYNPNNPRYSYYGGRGITICDEWKNDPAKFRDWSLENGYDDKLKASWNSLDRIDNDGPYSPENCRWVDFYVQASNRRKPVYSDDAKRRMGLHRRPKTIWTAFGETKPALELCEQYKVAYGRVVGLMQKYGLSLEQALTMPKVPSGMNRRAMEYWKSLGLFQEEK